MTTTIWIVWQEDEPVHGYYASEADAKRASIDCWQENEPACPDYSWHRDSFGWELLAGGDRCDIYISSSPVHGTPAASPAGQEAGPC